MAQAGPVYARRHLANLHCRGTLSGACIREHRQRNRENRGLPLRGRSLSGDGSATAHRVSPLQPVSADQRALCHRDRFGERRTADHHRRKPRAAHRRWVALSMARRHLRQGTPRGTHRVGGGDRRRGRQHRGAPRGAGAQRGTKRGGTVLDRLPARSRQPRPARCEVLHATWQRGRVHFVPTCNDRRAVPTPRPGTQSRCTHLRVSWVDRWLLYSTREWKSICPPGAPGTRWAEEAADSVRGDLGR